MIDPNQCPVKGCYFKKRLALCPMHWDMVDPGIKLAIYELSGDLEHAGLNDAQYDETQAKLEELKDQARRNVEVRLGLH